MTAATAVRWWPLVGLAGLIAVGLAVGKASTPLDAWFKRAGWAHPDLGRLLFFTDARVVFTLWAVTLVVALFRSRRRLRWAIVVTPLVAVAAARFAKRVFGRYSDDQLAYPSGHTTLAVVVLGLAVLVAGVAAWSVVLATVATVCGALGQAFTYHYFTDTIGAWFLGTALICLAVRVAKLDRCQPRCDLRHISG